MGSQRGTLPDSLHLLKLRLIHFRSRAHKASLRTEYFRSRSMGWAGVAPHSMGSCRRAA
jgi:hypothetical protein